MGRDGPQGGREWRPGFPPPSISLPCLPQFLLLLIRAELWELQGLQSCECRMVLSFILLAEQSPNPLISPGSSLSSRLGQQPLFCLSQGPWGGLDSLTSSRHPWPPRGFAGMSVAVPGWELPSHWALEQVYTRSTGPSRNTPSLPSGTQRACVYLPGEQNELFPLLWGGPCRVGRGQQEAQSRPGTSSQCQAPRARSAGTRNIGPCAIPPSPPPCCRPLAEPAPPLCVWS